MKKIYIVLILFLTINNYASHEWDIRFWDWGNYMFKAVDCLDSNNCLALAQDTFTVVLKSTDGGKVWRLIHDERRKTNEPIPVPNTSYDIDYTSENTFYISYEYGTIKKTTDMGLTFDTIQLFNNKHALIREMFMLDDNNGIAGYFKYVWVTNDGWETWRTIENEQAPPSFAVLDFWMFNENYFTYTDNRGYFWRTTDAGDTWKGAYFDKIDTVYPGMSHYCFVNDSIGYMVGYVRRYIGDTSKDLVWKTTNGGILWDLIYNKEYEDNSLQWNWGLDRVAFKDELTGVAVGQFGKVLSTTDGGVTWEQEFLHNKIKNNELVKTGAAAMDVTYAGEHPIITAFIEGIWRGTQIPTGINTHTREKNRIITYPNPCNDYLYFQFPEELHEILTTLQVFDINANLITQEEIYIQQGRLKYIHEIQTSGTYLWQMEVRGEIYSGKFIVG